MAYPALQLRAPNVGGAFLGGMEQGQGIQMRNMLMQQQQAQQQRDEQFRNILAQSVGPMAASAAQPPQDPTGSNYLMQATQNPLAGPSQDQFEQLVQLDPERAFEFQQQFEAQRQAQVAQFREHAAERVRAAQFVVKSRDPKRTLELGFPEVVQNLKDHGEDFDSLTDDDVRQKAQLIIEQLGPIAGMGPAGEGEGFTLGEGQVRFNAQGQEVARGPAKAENTTERDDKRFQQTQSLRKEYRDRVGAFDTVHSAYENIQNAQPNDAGDTQLVLNFMRVISPGIRVQPGERIDDAASVPGVPQPAISLWNKLVDGGKLNSGQRQELRSQAKRTYQSQRRLASEARQQFGNLAATSGLEPGQVVGEDWKPVAEYDANGVRTFDSVADAEAAGLKPGTKVIIGGRRATITED